MLNFLKKLFCKHSFVKKEEYELYDQMGSFSRLKLICACEKCGRKKIYILDKKL